MTLRFHTSILIHTHKYKGGELWQKLNIVSDGFAGLVGGPGFACSANIGEGYAIFEPTHGSASKYAEYETSIVNPTAMIISSCLMLEYLDEKEKAEKIRSSIGKVIEEGKVRCYDMLRMKGSPDVLKQGAASTSQMTDAIIEKL